jgi:ferredoxin
MVVKTTDAAHFLLYFISMVRKIKINPEKCDACGLCAAACHEGAIAIKNGKATLNQENLCDGLGHCLPACPAGAISFEEIPARTEAQWPLQIKLVPLNAPYFERADLLISADCAAYACRTFHEDFMRNRITLIGCPKLDNTDYSEKLARIIAGNSVSSLIAVRMEVPCCGGIERFLAEALKKSGKTLPMQVITLSIDGAARERR